jgi:hypothetical protein
MNCKLTAARQKNIPLGMSRSLEIRMISLTGWQIALVSPSKYFIPLWGK